MRLQSTWTHIRDHENPELYWYSETLGQDKFLHFLEDDMKARKNEAKKLFQNRTDLKNEVRRRISIWDELII